MGGNSTLFCGECWEGVAVAIVALVGSLDAAKIQTMFHTLPGNRCCTFMVER